VAALVVLAGALVWWLDARRFEGTDDAQVDAYITAVSARVAGTVTAVHVVDNQQVKAGEVLVELDPTDLDVALAQARAAVAQAEAAVAAENPTVAITQTSNAAAVQSAQSAAEAARTDADASQRELDQAQANDRLAQSQLHRANQLRAGGSIAASEYDQRVTQAQVARAGVAGARQRLLGRRAQLQSAQTRLRELGQNAPGQLAERRASVEVRQANLEAAQARLRQAELNRSYARVIAPADGIAGRRSVNVGEHIQPGQQLMALTQTQQLWVTANYRETQVQRMRAGQPVDLHVDALSRDFRGEVESFPGATGSRFSLFPPENASGNYVKVVQRLPVRVRLLPGQPELGRLIPGMSVGSTVKVR
jgi:membrane fusion protein (multidrug efflux system)